MEIKSIVWPKDLFLHHFLHLDAPGCVKSPLTSQVLHDWERTLVSSPLAEGYVRWRLGLPC